jgi:hypothetical protein
MKKKALAREDRKRQILLAFAQEIQDGNTTGEMTVANIAKHLHLSASTKLRDMVMELVIEGSLDFRDEPIPGIAKFRRIFSPDTKTFKRPSPEYKRQGRPIKITSGQKSFFAEMT